MVLDSTIHDADTLRFILGTEPRSVTAITQQANLASGELEDGVMAVLRFEDNVLVQIHGAYTLKYAFNGIEIHGAEGSIVGRGVMTQQPTGRVHLRNANGEEALGRCIHAQYGRESFQNHQMKLKSYRASTGVSPYSIDVSSDGKWAVVSNVGLAGMPGNGGHLFGDAESKSLFTP